ncbi:MAG: D-alanyl-D-alanine carboxypeptidase, partial [Gemmatimonadota bacterium]
ALPVAAGDGTLEGRLLGTPAAGNLRGKTGSLSSVRALSGYVTAGDGLTLVYSLLLNGYDGSGDVAIAMEDRLVEQLSLYRRPVVPGWPEHRPPGEDGGS